MWTHRTVRLGTLLVVALLIVLTLTVAAAGRPAARTGPTPAGALRPELTGPYFALKFSETGLPIGTGWSVALNETTGTVWNFSKTAIIEFLVPNGSYPFFIGSVNGFTSNPTVGKVPVDQKNTTHDVAFTPLAPSTYNVWFNESGLPGGTLWWVYLNGVAGFSTTASVLFSEPNGTYAFQAASLPDYTTSPTAGSITVSGNHTARAMTFLPFPTVTFVESGLKSGTVWSVTLDGTTEFSSGSYLTFSIANGTYSFGVGTVSQYTASPSSGSVAVAGGNQTRSIAFSPVVFLGLEPLLGYAVLSALITLLILIVVGLIVLALRRRRKGPAPGAPKPYAGPVPSAPAPPTSPSAPPAPPKS